MKSQSYMFFLLVRLQSTYKELKLGTWNKVFRINVSLQSTYKELKLAIVNVFTLYNWTRLQSTYKELKHEVTNKLEGKCNKVYSLPIRN